MPTKLTVLVTVPPAQQARLIRLHNLAIECYRNVSDASERLAVADCVNAIARITDWVETK